MNDQKVAPDWIPLADEALKRAAQRARDVAIQTNTGIVVMVDCKIVRISAEELRSERARILEPQPQPLRDAGARST